MQLRARGLGIAAITLAAVGVIASVVLPLIPAWPFVLLEHFRFQYVWAGGLVVAICAALKLRGWFDAALLATLVNACWVLPDLSRRARPLPSDGVPVRVLVLNVHTSSSAFSDVAKLVEDTKPDVIGLIEVNELWLAKLAPALASYPHHIDEPRPDNFGIALYSKLSLRGASEPLGSELPTIAATVDVPGAPLDVIVTHPIPPVGPTYLAQHVSHLDAVAQRARAASSRVVVMGDLNATPWSTPFRTFVAATHLCDTRAGFGLQASYPAESTLLRIPIDHVLASCSIGVRSRVIERDVGSDHLPVLIDLVIPRS